MAFVGIKCFMSSIEPLLWEFNVMMQWMKTDLLVVPCLRNEIGMKFGKNVLGNFSNVENGQWKGWF